MYMVLVKVFGGVATVPILYYIYLFFKNKDVVKFAWTVNGLWLPLFPFVGNIYAVLLTGHTPNIFALFEFLGRWCNSPFGFWFGSSYHYITDDIYEAKVILNSPKCLNKGRIYDQIQTVFPNTILIVDETSFGENSKEFQSKLDYFGEVIDFMQAEFAKLMLNPFIPSNIWLNLPLGAELKRTLEESKGKLREIIDKKKEDKKLNTDYGNDDSLIDLLLLKEYVKISNSDMLEEFYMFAGAAIDTTGHTLAFCALLLSMHQDIQQKLYEETQNVIVDQDIDSNVIRNLQYTDMVINETLRILPSVPFIARHCSDDVDIGERTLPKGSSAVINIFRIHRNPRYWKDADKFDPERFSPENIKKIVPGSFLPFSLGPRNCIGKSFAENLLKVTIASIVRDYQILSDHESINEFDLESVISMKTRQSLRCRFVPRMKN